MTPRKAAELAAYLPLDAAVWVEADPDNAWTINDYLTAATLHALNLANWQRGGGKGKQPKPIERPSEIVAKAEREERMFAALLAQRARKQMRGDGGGKVEYVTKSGKTVLATQAQIDNWNRGGRRG